MSRCYRFKPPRRSRLHWALSLTCLVSASAAHAGIELRSTTIDRAEKPPSIVHTTTLADEGSLRIDVRSGSAEETPETAPRQDASNLEHSTIYRAAFGDLLVVDHGERAFTLIDDDAIKDLEAQLQFAMLQLDRKMAELPSEQRKRMRDALKAPPQEPIRVEATDRKAEKGGLPCRLFEVRRGDVLVREVWVASWDDVAGGDELKASLEGLGKVTQRLDQAFETVRSMSLGGAQIFESDGNPFQDFERLGGLPVQTVQYEDGAPTFETSIDSVAKKELSPRDFLPPESFRKRSWSGD